MPAGWGVDVPTVDDLLGPSVDFAADPLADLYVGAANSWAWRKRFEAGYVDDTADTADDVKVGCGLYAVALFRERASVDGFQSFEEFPTSALTGGSLGQIRRMLGIGKARVDSSGVADPTGVLRRRRARLWLVR